MAHEHNAQLFSLPARAAAACLAQGAAAVAAPLLLPPPSADLLHACSRAAKPVPFTSPSCSPSCSPTSIRLLLLLCRCCRCCCCCAEEEGLGGVARNKQSAASRLDWHLALSVQCPRLGAAAPRFERRLGARQQQLAFPRLERALSRRAAAAACFPAVRARFESARGAAACFPAARLAAGRGCICARLVVERASSRGARRGCGG